MALVFPIDRHGQDADSYVSSYSRVSSHLPSDFCYPFLLFSSLTFVALRFIIYDSLVQSGLYFKLAAISDPNSAPNPYRLPYTNIPSLDRLLSNLVVFFHTLFDLSYSPLLAALFPVIGAVALVPYLEATRDRPPVVLRMPTAVGTAIQLASMGVAMPVYALLFVTTGTAYLRSSTAPSANPPSRINQGNAEALLFGVLLGYVLPTSLMLFLVRPEVTALWQAFPLLTAIAMFGHKVIRPPSRYVQSGHTTVLVTLVLSFVLSALLHVVYVWPILTDSAALQTMFVPVGPLDPAASSVDDGVLEFIKWDLIFGAGSVVLSTFWMVDGMFALVGILLWYGIATIVFGPAAAIIGVFLWRERRLNGQPQAGKIAQKME